MRRPSEFPVNFNCFRLQFYVSRAETERRQKLGPFKHVSSIVTPSTYSGGVAGVPGVSGLSSLGAAASTISPQIVQQGSNLNPGNIESVSTSSNGVPSGVQSDEGFGFKQGPSQYPLPYFPFQLRQNQQQQYHQQLPPLPIFVNNIPPQFQSPFSSHQPAFGYNQPPQQQNPFFAQQDQFNGINSLNSPFLGNQLQGVQHYTSNQHYQNQQQQQQQLHQNNVLSDDLSPSSIASQITNSISNQLPSSSQGPQTWFDQIGQNFQNFGQNIGNGFTNALQQFNQFGQNVGSTFGSFFNPSNGRYYSYPAPLNYRNVPGIQRELNVDEENADHKVSPLTKEADWYKSSENNKRAGALPKIPAEYDAPIEYHH